MNTAHPTGPNRWLNRFAWFTAVATLLLICSGGMVTSKGVGLAVTDWPTTFGYNMFLFPASKWVGGVFFEHTHRLIASTVGFLTLILATWLWFAESRRWVRNLGLVAVGAVILQGILGGLRVTMLKAEMGVFHACLAQAFLGLLAFIALVTSSWWERTLPACSLRHPAEGLSSRMASYNLLRRVALITTALIYIQLALGATMRHQHRDLSITDFPTAYGQWITDTSPAEIAKINLKRDKLALSDVSATQIWLQMAHRFGALLVALGVLAFFVAAQRGNNSALRKLSAAWLFLVAVQISLGAWTIWSNKAADVATAHVAVGAILFAFGIVICALCLRSRESSLTRPFSPATVAA